MIIGCGRITLYLADGHSLKDKRRVLQSIISRMRSKFNVAVAEIADQDLWQKITLGIAVIGGNSAHAGSQLQAIIDWLEAEPRLRVGEVETEIL
ncbi:hypothetical protein SAMN02745885_01735 [Carboxydocella sporoproducens DSM 16521]|uniref:YlxP-like protein n=2 Tax=Carboxydocella TaxID=178898 RepID=A0A1T4QPE0_9FIRM|nr:hypothetical protein CFE_2413 [Carboxydocella thermautotrophica]AVX32037.1 hypothetical protein CTH_2498 [Carboxydocella thermautotrophica]SKA05331.1 hypothetical protein SAMN02745885_01735 [Carboxydocella sporoproducens DSM 16521]